MRQQRPTHLQQFLHILFVVLFVITPLFGFFSMPAPVQAQAPVLPPIPFPETVPLEDLLLPESIDPPPVAPEVSIYEPPNTGGFVPPIGETDPITTTPETAQFPPLYFELPPMASNDAEAAARRQSNEV